MTPRATMIPSLTPRPITIAHPCQEEWDEMAPRGDGRHCARCAQTVVDLTTLAPAELDAFLTAAQERQRAEPQQQLCLRIRAQQGGVRVAGAQSARPARLRRRLTNGMATLMAMSLAGCAGSVPPLGELKQDAVALTARMLGRAPAVSRAPAMIMGVMAPPVAQLPRPAPIAVSGAVPQQLAGGPGAQPRSR